MKKLLAALAVLTLVLLPAAWAAEEDGAQALDRLGLFSGSEAGYELDRTPTRAEALVMLLKLTGQGRAAAEQVCKRAALAVELAGGDLKEEERECFYRALESITGRLREISREGLPKQP